MWARGVVMAAPCLDQDLGLPEIEEDFPRQQFIPELGVEALAVAILPWAARLDIERLHADALQPVAESRRDELGSVVGTYMFRRPMPDEQLAQRVEDIPRVELPFDPYGETLSCILIDHAQHTEHPPIMRPVLHEVIGPDMALVRRSEPHARAVVQPETATFRLFHRHFQPLSPPDAIDPLLVHMPALVPQECRDPAIAIPAELFGQADDRTRQGVLVIAADEVLALGRAVLADHAAGPTFGDAENFHHMTDRIAFAGGAQNFP